MNISRCQPAAVLRRPPLLLLLLLLLGSLIPHASAQSCAISTWRDEDLTIPYNISQTPSFIDGDKVCVKLNISTDDAPYPCYNITIKKVTVCTGTAQNMLPSDPGDLDHTCCNSPVTSGEVIKNVLYDASDPDEIFATYDPELVITQTQKQNFASFCFKSKGISEFNNVINVDWSYTAVECITDQTGGGGTCPPSTTPPPATGCATQSELGLTSTSGTTPDVNDQDSVQCSLFTTTTGGTIASMSAYITSLDSSSSRRGYQMAVYYTNSCKTNSMGDLLAQTNPGVITSTGWNTLAMPGSVVLSASTSYYLCYNTNASDGSHNLIQMKNGVSGYFTHWCDRTFASGYPTTSSSYFSGGNCGSQLQQGQTIYVTFLGCTTAPPTTAPPTTAPPTTTPAPTTTAPPTTAPPTTTPTPTTTAPPTTAPPTTTPAPTTTAPPTTAPPTTTPAPTTTEPPTTTPEPTTEPPTTTPDPTTTEPPTTTPAPTTTAPATTTPVPTTTAPPTTAPPLEGNGSCCDQFIVQCRKPQEYIFGVGCMHRHRHHKDPSLGISIGFLVFGILAFIALALWALLSRPIPVRVDQTVEIVYVESEMTGPTRNSNGSSRRKRLIDASAMRSAVGF